VTFHNSIQTIGSLGPTPQEINDVQNGIVKGAVLSVANDGSFLFTGIDASGKTIGYWIEGSTIEEANARARKEAATGFYGRKNVLEGYLAPKNKEEKLGAVAGEVAVIIIEGKEVFVAVKGLYKYAKDKAIKKSADSTSNNTKNINVSPKFY